MTLSEQVLLFLKLLLDSHVLENNKRRFVCAHYKHIRLGRLLLLLLSCFTQQKCSLTAAGLGQLYRPHSAICGGAQDKCSRMF